MRTADYIYKIQAGKDLDILIAEEVMGLVPCDHWELLQATVLGGVYIRNETCPHERGKCYPRIEPCQYSQNMSAAWLVVEKMNETDEFANKFDGVLGGMQPIHTMNSQEAALTICRAALLTVIYKYEY